VAAAVVVGMLLAIVSCVAVAALTLFSDHLGSSWSLLLVPLVGVGMIWKIRGRTTNEATARRKQLAEAAGIAFFGTCLAIVLLLIGSYEGN
jgi:hypothetical protein